MSSTEVYQVPVIEVVPPPLDLGTNADKVIVCRICTRHCRKPKTLACLHTFCEPCLEGTRQTVNKNRDFKCPKCGIKSQVLQGSIQFSTPNVYADQVNKHIAARMGTKGRLGCSSCTRPNVAISKCIDCDHFLCKPCEDAHSYMKALKDHRVEGLTSITKDPERFFQKTIYCYKHIDVNVTHFCETCHVAICRDCTVIDHREHKLLPLVGKIEEMLNIIENNMAESSEVYKSQVVDVTAERKNLSLQYSTIEAKITETFCNLRFALDEKELVLKEDLACIHKALEWHLIDQGLRLETLDLPLLSDVEGICEFILHVSKSLTRADSLSLLEMANFRLLEINYICKAFSDGLDGTVEFLTKETELIQNIQTFSKLSFFPHIVHKGKIETQTGMEGVTSTLKVTITNYMRTYFTNLIPIFVYITDPTRNRVRCKIIDHQNGTFDVICVPPMTGHYRIFISVHGEWMKDTFEVGPNDPVMIIPTQDPHPNKNRHEFCLDKDGVVYTLDRDTQLLSLYGKDGKFTEYFTKRRTEGFTKIAPGDTGIVSVGYNKMDITSYSSRNCFGTGAIPPTWREPACIATDFAGNLYVCDSDHRAIFRVSLQGFQMVELCSISSLPGVVKPVALSISEANGDIFVLDSAEARILKLNEKGQFLANIGVGRLQNPRGLATDSRGGVFVNDLTLKKVLCFSFDGEFMGNVCSSADPLVEATSVGVDKEGFVYVLDRGKNCIKKFRFDLLQDW